MSYLSGELIKVRSFLWYLSPEQVQLTGKYLTQLTSCDPVTQIWTKTPNGESLKFYTFVFFANIPVNCLRKNNGSKEIETERKFLKIKTVVVKAYPMESVLVYVSVQLESTTLSNTCDLIIKT